MACAGASRATTLASADQRRQRNPTGFSLSDTPVLGLLVRVWKLLKEVIRYYEADNAEIIAVLERPLIEAAVTAEYLLSNGDAAVEDYRKISYKDRLRILRNLKEGTPFFETKAGQRLLKSVRAKMAFEGLTENDFEEQKKNRWRLQGKTFFDIFAEVVHQDLYASSYGMMSESVHGSARSHLPERLDGYALCAASKLAFLALSHREALAWRLADLGRCGRGFRKAAVRRRCSAHARRGSMGDRIHQDILRPAINVLSFVDAVDKDVEGFARSTTASANSRIRTGPAPPGSSRAPTVECLNRFRRPPARRG
jgi:hypothetical protein